MTDIPFAILPFCVAGAFILRRMLAPVWFW